MSTGYRFRAARPDGTIVSGFLEAPGPGPVCSALHERGLHPIAVSEADSIDDRRPAASRDELAAFFRCLASLSSAGVPLERALASAEQLVRGGLAETARQAGGKLREGKGLADALASGRGVVPAVVLGILRGGERGSRLDAALEAAATHLEQEAELLGRIRQALAYPMVIGAAGLVSIVVITTIVVPRFAVILSDLGQELPLATRWLLGAASFTQRYGVWIIAVMMLTALSLREAIRRPEGRKRLHRSLLALPIIGPLRHLLASARLMRSMGGMLQSGMPLLPALDGARDTGGDLALAEHLDRARDLISQGQPIARAFAAEQVLPPLLQPLLAVGEESGRLGPMMLRAGDIAALEGERALRTLVGLLEPALVVFFGGAVAFVAAALLQAVYSLRPVGP
jgi:general secretion pathway protein F